VNGDDQTPAEGTAPAPAKRTPSSRSTPKTAGEPATSAAPRTTGAAKTGAARTGASATRKPVTGARKPAGAKPATDQPATTTDATVKAGTTAKQPATKPGARRTAAGKAAASKAAATAKPDEQGDVPSILETALAGHNASVRASVDAVESGTLPEPTATVPQETPAAESTTPVPEATATTATTATAETTEPTTRYTEATPPTGATASTEPPIEATAEGDLAPTEAQTAAEAPDGTVPSAGYRSVTDFAERLDDTRFFSSLFDFTFTNYVTRKLAGPVYVVGLVLIGLSTVLAIIYSLTVAIGTHSFLGAFVFLFGVIITLVGTILSVLLLRVGIEVFVAIIEIAQNTRGRKKERH
jgi:hypothetical protein